MKYWPQNFFNNFAAMHRLLLEEAAAT